MKITIQIEVDSQRLQDAIDNDQILQLTATGAPRQREAPAAPRNGRQKFPICEIDGCRSRAKSVEGLCRRHAAAAAISDEARELAQRWIDHPATVAADDHQVAQWQKLFGDLHRLDGLAWEEIRTISDYALDNWVDQGYMLSPMKLRNRSKSYSDLKCWQIIKQQQKNGFNRSNTIKEKRWSEAVKNIDFS